MSEELYPSREAHLGQNVDHSKDVGVDQLTDVEYLINQYRHTGDTMMLKKAASLIDTLIVEIESKSLTDNPWS